MKPFYMLAALILFIIIFPVASETANGGVFDRIKGIYNAPDELQKIQDQYDATKALMESQLELSRQQTMDLLAQQEELLRSSESYRDQNEKLMAENQQLMERMEKMESSRKSLYEKAILTVGILIALVAAYALSVRIWRFVVWRKQRREQQGVLLP